MRTIKRHIRTQQKMRKGAEYYKLHTYEVVDEQGNSDEIDSMTPYELGERVELWFDAQYNKIKMRKYQKTRS